MSSTTQASEQHVRAAQADGDHRRAATVALEEFGPEILRFLRVRLRSRSEAEEAYLQFSEDLWVGLPGFRWESSLRVWLFVLARNAATRVGRAERRALEIGLDREGLDALQVCARTSTARFMRTEIKDRMREIRQKLDEDAQTLLILRVDRGLEWRELAVVMNEVPSDADEAALARASARLRTRFQAAKQKLRALAEAEGLVSARTEDTRRPT